MKPAFPKKSRNSGRHELGEVGTGSGKVHGHQREVIESPVLDELGGEVGVGVEVRWKVGKKRRARRESGDRGREVGGVERTLEIGIETGAERKKGREVEREEH